MKIEVKVFEVYLGADNKTNFYTINIPKLKIFNSYEIKKDPISAMEKIANELITEKMKL